MVAVAPPRARLPTAEGEPSTVDLPPPNLLARRRLPMTVPSPLLSQPPDTASDRRVGAAAILGAAKGNASATNMKTRSMKSGSTPRRIGRT